MSPAPAVDQERVLVLAPTPADAALTRTIIADAGLVCHVDEDSDSLARGVSQGVGAIVLTEEVITRGDNRELARVLTTQPSWSEIPIILLVGVAADASVTATALALLGNVTILERPVRVTTLVSILRAGSAAGQQPEHEHRAAQSEG